jgi:hypothetical protein
MPANTLDQKTPLPLSLEKRGSWTEEEVDSNGAGGRSHLKIVNMAFTRFCSHNLSSLNDIAYFPFACFEKVIDPQSYFGPITTYWRRMWWYKLRNRNLRLFLSARYRFI